VKSLFLRAAGRAALLAGASLASAAEPAHSLADDAKAFGARPNVRSVAISPSGTKLLMINSVPGRASVLQVIDLATKANKIIARSAGNPDSLYWCEFGSDTQLVCKFGGETKVDRVIAGFSRIVAVPVDGSKFSELGQPTNYYKPVGRQFDGEILDWLPDSPGSVLMERTYIGENIRPGSHIADSREGLGVDRVDLTTLKASEIEKPRTDAGDYLTDGRGHVRVMATFETEGEEQMLTGLVQYKFRRANSSTWENLTQYDERTKLGSIPIAVEGQTDSALVLQKLNGRDALYRVKLDGTGASTLVASNQMVDIDDVVRVGRGQRIIGYTDATDRREVNYFDPEFSKLHSALGAALQGNPEITFEGASSDGNKIIVLASSDVNPGMFYLFDKTTKHLDEIAPVRPELEGRTLAHVQSVRVPAGDGVDIPAYLTLPPGSSGRNLPAVVLPHGGPSARDEWGFDWLAQFLVARGYAVIQPNYRGSAGYGDQWEGANGFKDWPKAMGDIAASARYLANQGIADPKRLAILGWSYGGYAALQSAVMYPEIYKAVVAIAPVTDLSLLKTQATDFTNGDLVARQIGSGPNLDAGSPAHRAAEIKAPVLLVHGDLDINVDISHSEKMLSALQAQGKKAQLLSFKGLNHQLDDSDARTQMLTGIGEFLDAAIGH
jgi:dipeptidyl aminopeptidase/acylaminoacyl peptidase